VVSLFYPDPFLPEGLFFFCSSFLLLFLTVFSFRT